MGGALLDRENSGPFLDQLRLVYQRSNLPVALLGAQFQVLWASDSILELFPGLRLPSGAMDLLSSYAPKAIQEEIQSQGHFVTHLPDMLFSGRGLTICQVGEDGQGPVYLLQPAGETEDSSPQYVRRPLGLERVLGAFNSQFRLPLSRLFLEVDRLRDAIPEGPGRSAAEEALRRINQQAYLMLRSVQWITAYADSCYARPILQTRPGKALDLFGSLRQLCASCAELLEEVGIPLHWDIPQGRFPVLCQREELELIFLNLISNSCRFTRPGNAIHVRACAQGSGGMVTVSDLGRGIPAQIQPLVFQPYFSYNPGEGPFSGLGLGLSCVKGLVASLGGTVALTSQEGEGTSVTFTLPTASGIGLPLSLEASSQDYLQDRFSLVYVALADSVPPPL